jgi:hypothetical protein
VLDVGERSDEGMREECFLGKGNRETQDLINWGEVKNQSDDLRNDFETELLVWLYEKRAVCWSRLFEVESTGENERSHEIRTVSHQFAVREGLLWGEHKECSSKCVEHWRLGEATIGGKDIEKGSRDATEGHYQCTFKL